MESKRKSFFNEIGFKPTIEKLVDLTAKLYLEDDNPWVVGYSGGKDSSACLQLMWRVLEKIKSENKPIKPLHVITTDTLVENPVVATWVKTSLDLLRDKAKEKGLPIFPSLLTPNIEETFWVNLIGKGYPAPNNKFRWCTERMKIRPSDRFLRKITSESGEAILVIGTRKAESSNRATSITRFEKEATRENFSKHVNLLNVNSYLPIKDWTNDDVWLYLLQEQSPWGINNKDLLSMYQGATDGGECPLVVDTSTPSCGDSRFGCWVCTLVKQDKSMSAMIQNDQDKEWMTPLLKIRNELDFKTDTDRQKDRDSREFVRMNGQVSFYKNNDEKYRIEYIAGKILYENNIKECYKKMFQIVEEIKKTLPNTSVTDDGMREHVVDKSGKSKVHQVFFSLMDGEIVVSCYDWDIKMQKDGTHTDTLSISLRSSEFENWLTHEAYK